VKFIGLFPDFINTIFNMLDIRAAVFEIAEAAVVVAFIACYDLSYMHISFLII
jgi:hypothetical protein